MDGEISLGMIFGIVFVLSGLAFKMSAAPFHMWTPDVYEGAPTPVTAFFAGAPKVAASALTIRVVVEAFGNQTIVWQQIVIVVALMSIIIGAVGAIGQQNLKRLLAYSSINNIGFILIGLAAGTEQGVAAMLVYLAIYVAMTLGSFIVLMQLRRPRRRISRNLCRCCGTVKNASRIGGGVRHLHVQPWQAFRRCSVSGANWWCFKPPLLPICCR